MTLLAPIPLATVAYLGAGLAALVVLAYVLKMRRRRFEVPFSSLWHRVLEDKKSSSLWKQLKRLLSLLLLLTILGLLLFAVTEPRLGEADRDARSVVILLDASASMKATDADGDRPRIELAKEETVRILESLGGGDAAMVMRMDGRVTPLSRFHSDFSKLEKTVTEVRASDTPADLRSALSAAADALRDRQNPTIILVGDGAYPEAALDSAVWQPAATPAAGEPSARRLDAIDLSGIDVRYVPIGSDADNVGIVAFNVRRYITNKLNYEVYIEVENFAGEPARRRLVLYDGGVVVDVKDLELAAGERLRQIYPDLGGGQGSVLRAALEPVDGGSADAFALDDSAWALMPAQKQQKVLLVTAGNHYLENAIEVYDNIVVDVLSPADYEAQVAASKLPVYDAVVFDALTPETLPPPPTDLLYFGPEGEHSPFPIRRSLAAGRITQVDDAHSVTRWVEMNDVNFDALSVFAIDPQAGEVALATSIRSPVAAARSEDGRKIAAFGFALSGTDLVLRVAFPLLLVNSLDWFAGTDSDYFTTYRTGERASVPMDGSHGVSEVTVTEPSGRLARAPLDDGHVTFYAVEVGVHTLEAATEGGARIRLAANLADPSESDIEPSTTLRLGGQELSRPEGFVATRRQGIWTYLVLAVLALLCVEWFTYNRRITV